MRLATALLLLLAMACAHDLSSEERMDRELSGLPQDQASLAELKKVSCAEDQTTLQGAQNVPNEAKRLETYMALFAEVRDKVEAFETAMSRNPDLRYQENQELNQAHQGCVEQKADVQVEFERFLRELVEVPTVQEVKGGGMVVVARLDFVTLRRAIEVLDPSDKSLLFGRLQDAEGTISAR